jgi:hypothetical protein
MSKSNKSLNITIGVIGVGIFMACLALSGYQYFNYKIAPELSNIIEEDLVDCRRVLVDNGMTVYENDLVLTAKFSGVDNYLDKITRSGIAVLSCSGFKFKSFCMGSCGSDNNDRGLVMALEHNTLRDKSL